MARSPCSICSGKSALLLKPLRHALQRVRPRGRIGAGVDAPGAIDREQGFGADPKRPVRMVEVVMGSGIDLDRDPRAASMGNMLVTRAKIRGGRAVITDGAYRDGAELSQMDFPTYGTGITSTTRLSFHHVADLQVPIGCAGVAVYPGDVIHGDADGVTVIPAEFAEEMANTCEKRDDIEAYLWRRVRSGEALWGLYPPSDETRRQHVEWVKAGRPPIREK